MLHWFRDDTSSWMLARDAGIGISTAYRYLYEGIDVLAAQAPDLHGVLARGKEEGWSHVHLDGTLIETDRCAARNDNGHRTASTIPLACSSLSTEAGITSYPVRSCQARTRLAAMCDP